MGKVIDFSTGKTLDETFNIHELASDILYTLDENHELPNFILAMALLYLANELIRMEKYHTPDMDYITLAKIIHEAYL